MWIELENGMIVNLNHLEITFESGKGIYACHTKENMINISKNDFERIKQMVLNQNKNIVFISYKDIEGKIWKRAKSEFKNYKTRCICCKKIQVKYFGAYCTSCFNWCAYKCYFLLEWKDKIKELKELMKNDNI